MINKLAEVIEHRLINGGKVIICGNGGLAADSEHFAAEMMGKYAFPIYLPCISLTSNTSLITALANDFSFEEVFSRQIVTIGKSWDLLIAMTTSKSPNILNALIAAMDMGMDTVCLCGPTCRILAKHTYQFDGVDSGEIQNHIIEFLHKVAYEVKSRIYQSKQS